MPGPLVRCVGIAALLAAAAAAPAQVRPDRPGAERIAAIAAQVLQRAAERDDFNGAVVLMRDGQIVYEGAVGLAERGPDRPFRPDTPSDGGSLAKTLTATLVWERAQQGRLPLDGPVVRQLPSYPQRSHTMGDLAHHRNGLPDYGFFANDFAPGQPRDTVDLLAVLARRQPADIRAPGIVTEYSNLGFDLAGLVIEQLDGRRLGGLLRERFFTPLGMDTAFARPARFADWPGPRTHGYRRDGEGWVDHDAFDGEAHIGASNVVGSARDWARWGDAFAREKALPQSMLDAGLRQPIVNSGMDNTLTALSWYCDGPRQRCHYTGQHNGFFAQVWWDRSRREALAYVSNHSLAAWRCATLTREWIAALQGQESPVVEPPPVLRLPRAERSALSGVYDVPGLGPLELQLSPQHGWVRVGDGERATVFAVPVGVLYAPTLDLWLRFTGTVQAPVLQVQSVFHVGQAPRR